MVEDAESHKRYAMKKLICQTAEQRKLYEHEVEIMKEVAHCAHVVRYFGEHEIIRPDFLAVSYTHLTLPTTPYV